MRHYPWIAGGLLVLAAASFVGCGRGEPNASSAGAETGPTKDAQTLIVEEQTVPEWLEATGTVRTKLEATLAAKIMSRVVSVSVREGDAVRKGQVLVELEGNDLAAAEELARAGLEAAKVNLGNSQTVAKMERAMSEARLSQAQSGLKQAEAALMVARSRLDLAKAGPRRQERAQAELAVRQAETQFELAQNEFRRVEALYREGAV
ncbi:MAG: biotin/lipoyl-binding protein, partial [Fimbriimonadales bacterium]